jgi:type II secretion system protein I
MTSTRSSKLTRASRGFTLIETLLALAILAAAAAGVLAARSNAVRNALRAQNERTAAMLAGQLLTEVALRPPSSDSARRGFEGYPGFSYRVVVQQVDFGALGPVRKVRIDIFHSSLNREGREDEILRLETLVKYEAG